MLYPPAYEHLQISGNNLYTYTNWLLESNVIIGADILDVSPFSQFLDSHVWSDYYVWPIAWRICNHFQILKNFTLWPRNGRRKIRPAGAEMRKGSKIGIFVFDARSRPLEARLTWFKACIIALWCLGFMWIHQTYHGCITNPWSGGIKIESSSKVFRSFCALDQLTVTTSLNNRCMCAWSNANI